MSGDQITLTRLQTPWSWSILNAIVTNVRPIEFLILFPQQSRLLLYRMDVFPCVSQKHTHLNQSSQLSLVSVNFLVASQISGSRVRILEIESSRLSCTCSLSWAVQVFK